MIKILNISALSYSGTTWLNLLLGSHPDVLTIGPPHRLARMLDGDLTSACLVHGANCSFWPAFARQWDRKENLFVALERFSGRSVFICDNASAEFLAAHADHRDIELLPGRYIRDGRAISASYARRMKSVSYIESIRPDGWLWGSFQAVPGLSELQRSGKFYARYEDVTANPTEFLGRAGKHLGLTFSEDAHRFWEWDHHITTGNQGPIAMVRMHQALPVAKFESHAVYAEQLERLKRNPLAPFADERWKAQLSRKELYWFDQLLGEKNAALGYERDRFTRAEVKIFGGPNIVKKQSAASRIKAFARRVAGRRMLKEYLYRLKREVRRRLPRTKSAIPAAPTPGKPFYQDRLDKVRLAALLPYQTRASNLSLDAVETNVNVNFFAAYGPDFAGKTPAHMSVDGPWQYRDLLSRLKAIPNLRFATVRDAVRVPPKGSEIVCTIRHDIDGDLVAAAQQARIEQALGISTSYYVLHTAPYYGSLSDNVFVRNNVSAQRYREIQSAGHEIALHTDGMTLYQSYNIDGAAAIVEELKWLRSEGLNVTGSTAHNSFSVYGCNNYSIFKNRPLAVRRKGGPRGVIHNGKWAPLQVLSEKALGLEYEANDLFWQEHTPLFYGCLMTQNDWHMEHDKHALLTDWPTRDAFYGTHDDLVDAISALQGPTYVKLVVHPMHYGLRSSSHTGPWLPEKAADETKLGTRRWAGGGVGEEVAGTAITRVNEFATADRGLDCYQAADFRIVFFGHDNVGSHRVSTDSKLPAVLARRLRGPLRKPRASAISVCDPQLTGSRIEKAFSRIDQAAPADVIIFGLSAANPHLDEIVGLAREWGMKGRNVLCFLECGPDPVTAPDEDMIRRVESKLGRSVHNPYAAFDAYEGSGRLYWDNSGGWAPQAHFLAAKMLAERVRELLSDSRAPAAAV